MDPQPDMNLPGTELEQNDYFFDRALNRTSQVQIATNSLKTDSVEFLEATYLVTLKWFGFRIDRADLKAHIQKLKPAITFDP